ncbi:MAG: hypothetical protein KIG65_04840 [Eubacteriales bacterium]|nr:hypothetical protein [Eubacteriales bacterium]
MGVILFGEVSYIIKLNPKNVVISGHEKLKEAINIIHSEKSNADVISIPADKSSNATALGMVKIYEYR